MVFKGGLIFPVYINIFMPSFAGDSSHSRSDIVPGRGAEEAVERRIR